VPMNPAAIVFRIFGFMFPPNGSEDYRFANSIG